jgi:TubC N-terminal docking domain
MSPTALLETLRGRGWTFALDDRGIGIRRPRGAMTDELRQALLAEKAAIVTILAAEQQRAQMPLQGDEPVAVKVWSEILQEAIWVVADDVPLDPYLADGRVYTRNEIRVLLVQGRGVKVWAPLDPETEG